MVVIALFLVLIVGLLVMPGCKELFYNVSGEWTIQLKLNNKTFIYTYTFVGDSQSGKVYVEGDSLGNYSVVGDNVNFTLEYIDTDGDHTVEVYKGSFSHMDRLVGTMTYSVEGYQTINGTWSAER